MTVKAGDKLNHKLSAAKWNALDTLLKKTPGVIGAAEANEARDGIVMVRNLTGIALSEGSIVALRDPVFLPADNLDEFRYAMVFNAVVPTDGTDDTGGNATTDYSGRFAVMLAPCAIGEMAAACCAGIVAAKVSITASGDGFADVYHNSTAKLKSGSTGSAQILWPNTTTGSYPQDTWAIVRLGNKAAAGGLDVLLCATSYGNTLTSTGIGSSSSDPRFIKFVAAYEPRPDWADFDDPNDLPIIKTAGKYLVFLSAVIEWPPITGDAQEIQVQLGVRTTSGGTPVFSYANINATVGRSGFSGSFASSVYVSFGLAEFAAGDMLSLRAYHGDAGHTKVASMSIDTCYMLLIPYNPAG